MKKQERVLPKTCLMCGGEIPRRNTYCRACAYSMQIERVKMNYKAIDSVLRELATENERRHALGLDSLSYGK